jgi:hypothetical protein
MKYTIQKLDGRFSYNNDFNYCIKFSNRMSGNNGPLEFTRSHKWFVDTYGWSAEIRQWSEIRNWYTKSVPMMSVKGGWARPVSPNTPPECNPIWSWSNGYEDLRIYVASDKELAFFRLAHQVD